MKTSLRSLMAAGACALALTGGIVALDPAGPAPGAAVAQGEPARAAVSLFQQMKRGFVPPGALRRAAVRKSEMNALKDSIAGAAGVWQPYGSGPLVVNDPDYPSVNGVGYVNTTARVDNLAIDLDGQRLFAAVGPGGIWMSEASGGDLKTLGDQWVPISDHLPSTVVGAVGWTPASGGTLLVGGGEASNYGRARLGLGAFWSTDLGVTWQRAEGVPDEIASLAIAVDPSRPEIVYLATTLGLFRSADAGRSYENVRLPTSAECAGVSDITTPCVRANVVSDVIVKAPGGTTGVTCGDAGCPVLAAVGHEFGGQEQRPDGGGPYAPGNGLYRSQSGEPGSFERIDVAAVSGLLPVGFAPQERIGRVELGAAVGPEQDHDYVYAIVSDALANDFENGMPFIDVPGAIGNPLFTIGRTLNDNGLSALPYLASELNGIYVSADFGESWIRMADDIELLDPLSGSTTLLPGGQAAYNMWVEPDPTRALLGIPTRLAFGLEEVWTSRVAGVPQNGLAQLAVGDFVVIGAYYAGCTPLGINLPTCPTSRPMTPHTTTHADQHAGLWVPTPDGGVCLFAGNDGGVYRQCLGPGEDLDNGKWGGGANGGFYALSPYGLAVSGDGTVWYGLQDNGSGKIDSSGRSVMTVFADGVFAAVDPDNSDIAYTESQYGGLKVTTTGGRSWTTIAPSTVGLFEQPYAMDSLDPHHLIFPGTEVYETTAGPATSSGSWTQVFNLNPDADPADYNFTFGRNASSLRLGSATDLQGNAAYVAFCGPCDQIYANLVHADPTFSSGIATNVGGSAPPGALSTEGWHFAGAAGLPKRFITSVEIDPNDERTIYVALAGYYKDNVIPGSFGDQNAELAGGNVFKSTDAGETFTDISGNLPGIHADSVIVRGDQLLLGTEAGAFISSDLNGTQWAPLGSGLPNAPVTMLQLRPGDPNHLFAATYGRHIWHYRFDGKAALPASEVPGAPASRAAFGGALSLGLLMGLVAALARRAQRLRPMLPVGHRGLE